MKSHTHLLLVSHDPWLDKLKHVLDNCLSQLSVLDPSLREGFDKLCKNQSANYEPYALLEDILYKQMDVSVQACLVFPSEEFIEECLVSRGLVFLGERS